MAFVDDINALVPYGLKECFVKGNRFLLLMVIDEKMLCYRKEIRKRRLVRFVVG